VLQSSKTGQFICPSKKVDDILNLKKFFEFKAMITFEI